VLAAVASLAASEGFFDYHDTIRREHGPDAPLFPHITPKLSGFGPAVAGAAYS
jgi:hypothetical protein